jgi:hypothetical protein
VDTVHQGDQDGKKGVYHINAVDEVTQYEVVLSTTDAFLLSANALSLLCLERDLVCQCAVY